MVCINCLNSDTKVINSRAHKKTPSVWRRRQCESCLSIFTTREKVDLTVPVIKSGSNKPRPYSKATLAGSIFVAINSAGLPAEDAYWLSDTVEDALILQMRAKSAPVALETTQIKLSTYNVLLSFNPAAAIAYGSLQAMNLDQKLKPLSSQL